MKETISRRELVKALAIAVTAWQWLPLASAGAPLPSSGERLLIGDGVQLPGSPFQRRPLLSQPGHLRIWSAAEGVKSIDCPFLPHAIVREAQRNDRVFAFEKWGTHAACFDLAKLRMTRLATAKDGRRFFGHAAIKEGLLYVTQMRDEDGEGIVAVLDAATLAIEREIPTQGAYPHDCQWSSDGKALIILNSREKALSRKQESPSVLVWMDPGSGEIKRRLSLGNTEGGYAHFALVSTGEIVVGGSIDGPHSIPLIAVVDKTGVIHPLPIPKEFHLKGEALSLALDEKSGTVAATFPLSGAVHTWNYRTREPLTRFSVAEPRGLIFSSIRHGFLVSSARERSWNILETSVLMGPAGNGSHAAFLGAGLL